MVHARKHLLILKIVLLFGNLMGSENSEDFSKTPELLLSQDLETLDVISQPLENGPNAFFDVNEAESKDNVSKGLPENILLVVITDQDTTPNSLKENELGSEPIKNESKDLSNVSTKNPDVPDNATESTERGETEDIFLNETEISGNQLEHAENVKETMQVESTTMPEARPFTDIPKFPGNFFTQKATASDEPVKTNKGHDSLTPSAVTTANPKVVQHGQPANTGLKVESEKVQRESSKSNAIRKYNLSLAYLIFNLVTVIATANNFFELITLML